MGIRQKLDNVGARASRFADERQGLVGRIARFGRYEWRLWFHSVRRLRENNAMAMSAALSFRTIFALIPTLVLMVLILQSLGQQERARKYLDDYIVRSGITSIRLEGKGPQQPATGPASAAAESSPASAAAGSATRPATGPAEDVISVQGELDKVVTMVEKKVTFGRLGPIGLVLLIWTALTLMITIERSLNRIFQAPAGRSVGRQALLYWSTMTLGPVAMVAALAAGEMIMAYAKGFLESQPLLSWVLIPLGVLQPIAVGIILFAGAYALIPNTKVKLRAAMAGAVVAFPVWLVAMWGFSLYVTRVVGKDPLYGTLGLLPLFLLWLNTSWLVFILGAEIAHTSDELRRGGMKLDDQDDPRDALVGQWDLLAAALAVAGPFGAGKGPVGEAEVVARLRLRPRNVRILLDDLVERKLLCPVEREEVNAYVPGKPVEKTCVWEVADLADQAAQPQPVKSPTYDKDLADAVSRARQAARAGLGELTLADLLK
jgi:membrane protein